MTNSTYTIQRPSLTGTRTISTAISILMLANQGIALVDYFKNGSPTPMLSGASVGSKPVQNALPALANHVTTENWVCSPEHENALLLDIGSAGLSPGQALAGLRKLYPRKEDTTGVRMLSNGSKMLIIFATKELQQHALLYGFELSDTTVLYGTKALNGDYNHTLLVIEGLPIADNVTTRTKVESSLNDLFASAADPRQGQHRVPENPWPPTVHDVFFHPSNSGFYNGKVTVIFRGSVTFLQRAIQLKSFDNVAFNCKVHRISFYCHHCMRIDRHLSKYCPHVRREAT